jgi:hypothetical protein
MKMRAASTAATLPGAAPGDNPKKATVTAFLGCRNRALALGSARLLC